MKYSVKYSLTFEYRKEDELLIVHSDSQYEILSQFLMYWNNPYSIVRDLLPEINRGIKFGVPERWKVTDNWSGYFIEEENSFLEGIDADVIGIAFVKNDITTIEGSDIGLVNITVPSLDFKEIVIEWLSFILKNKEILPN